MKTITTDEVRVHMAAEQTVFDLCVFEASNHENSEESRESWKAQKRESRIKIMAYLALIKQMETPK